MHTSPSTTGAQAVTVSLLTPPGRGALAVVGVRGCGAAMLVDQAFAARGARPIAALEDGAIAYGTWRATGEHVVVARRRADVVEVHCHGGIAAAAAVTGSLVAAGAAEVPWSAWLAASGAGATIVEAHENLVAASPENAIRFKDVLEFLQHKEP